MPMDGYLGEEGEGRENS